MKSFFKRLGRFILFLLTGALLYYISATVYYKVTGDDSHSGMLGLKCFFIYSIVMLTEGYIRRIKKMKETGVLFGRRSAGGNGGGNDTLNGCGTSVYTLGLLSLFSLMLYLIVPENSVLDDPLLYVFSICGFTAVIFGVIYVIARLSDRSRVKKGERNSAYSRRIIGIYGPFNPDDTSYFSDELYQNGLARFLISLFGKECSVYGLFDKKTNALGPDVTAEQLIARLDSDPRLLVRRGYMTKSLYALRTGINMLCAANGYGIQITEADTERMRALRDDQYSERCRRDGRADHHDLSIIDCLLREKGYRLIVLTGYFYDNSLYTDELAHYQYAEYSEEDVIYDDEADVTVREYITVCEAGQL